MTMVPHYIDGQELWVSHEYKSHRRLWAAVFLRGLHDAAEELKARAKTAGPPPIICYEALTWLYADSMHPGGFGWLCEMFDIDPGRARDSWRMQVRKLAKEPQDEHD